MSIADFTADQALSTLRTPSRRGPPPPPLERAGPGGGGEGLGGGRCRHCMGKYAGLPVMGTASDAFQTDPKMIYEGALKGLALPLIKQGRDCPGVELMSALASVMGDAEAPKRWWRGQAVFPEDCRLDWFPPVRRK